LGDTQASQVTTGIESECNPQGNSTILQESDHSRFFHVVLEDTENVEDVWSQSLPHLRGVQDFDQNVKDVGENLVWSGN